MVLSETEAVKTVVAVFIDGGKLLMEQRANNRKVYSGFLMCPSGHVKENESLERAIKRVYREFYSKSES